MRFPGDRFARHYFPVTRKATRVAAVEDGSRRWFLLGLDEVLVDLEVRGPAELARELGLIPGESIHLSEEQCRRMLERFDTERLARTYVAGGTVANTLNNYTHLSGEPAILLGAIEASIRPGTPAFAYVAQTPKAVDLGYLRPVQGTTGTAITFISPDGERSFGVAPGVAAQFPPEAVPEEKVRESAVVLASLYGLRDPSWPIAQACLRMMAVAKEAGVPVAFGLGTAGLVREKRDELRRLLEQYVTVAAMNAGEAEALTGHADALLACETVLDWVDVAIVTEGPRGLTMGGYTDETTKRETTEVVRSKSIPDYNRWEFSRLMRRADCERPLKVYSHAHPYRGGPDHLSSTNGAGDAALAAVLHDIAANGYHRTNVPHSEKHAAPARFLTYSSLSRNTQYGNRVAYEVLSAASPRLDGPVGHDEGGD